MSSIQQRHAPGARAVSRRSGPEAGECVMGLRMISCLVPSCGGRALACSPGDPACAEGTLPAPQVATSHRDWAGEDSARVLWIASRLRLAAGFAQLGNGGVSGLVASMARVSR
jgi:hypothetical protein